MHGILYMSESEVSQVTMTFYSQRSQRLRTDIQYGILNTDLSRWNTENATYWYNRIAEHPWQRNGERKELDSGVLLGVFT